MMYPKPKLRRANVDATVRILSLHCVSKRKLVFRQTRSDHLTVIPQDYSSFPVMLLVFFFCQILKKKM